VADEVIAASCAWMIPSGVGWLILQTTGDSPKAIDRTQVAADEPRKRSLNEPGVMRRRARFHGGGLIQPLLSQCQLWRKKNQPGYRSRLLIGYMLNEAN
jgi:hypothetical protein